MSTSSINEDTNEALDAILSVSEMIQERNYVSMAQFFEHLFAAFASHYKATAVPEIVESSYTGIHLGAQYEENDFIKMIDGFNKNQPLHAKYAFQILSDAVKLLKQMENIRTCDLNASTTQLPGVIIVGDLHGNFHDLYYIIKKYGVLGKNYRFVFNGDIVDRGPQQIECLLTLLYGLLMYPTRVFVNRGNHEDKSCNLNENFRPNFKVDVYSKFGQYGAAIFNESQRVFRYLPVATIVKNKVGFKCFVVHGGVSTRLDLDYVARGLPRNKFEIIAPSRNYDSQTKYAAEQLSDLLWSDPIVRKGNGFNGKVPSENGCFPNSSRGLGWLFGPDVTEWFCKKYGFSAIIRSHEVRPEGITKDHGRCFTIFSCSRYCQGTNQAAVIILPAEEQNFRVDKFSTQRREDDGAENERKALIGTFKRLLAQEKDTLLRRFAREDSDNNGYISLDKWAEIIVQLVYDKTSVNIEPRHVITLRDYLCPCEDEDQTAKYREMFTSEEDLEGNKSVMGLLEQIFVLIDTNQSGTISTDEALRAIDIINRSLNTSYDHSFISSMDTNRDGEVDFNEFKKAFLKAV